MTDFPKKSLKDWRKLAGEELKRRDPDALTWQTPEGIPVKPLYTAEDRERIEDLGNLPTYRVGSRRNFGANALGATIVGNWREPSGGSRL